MQVRFRRSLVGLTDSAMTGPPLQGKMDADLLIAANQPWSIEFIEPFRSICGDADSFSTGMIETVLAHQVIRALWMVLSRQPPVH